MASRLETILQELARTAFLSIKDLKPDRNQSCLIRLPTGIEFQMESDTDDSHLLVGCDLGDVAAGRYREQLFRHALQSNGKPYPRHGTFAYSTKTEHLILFDSLIYDELTGDKLALYLEKFIQKALLWKNAINSNDIPQDDDLAPSPTANIFNMVR